MTSKTQKLACSRKGGNLIGKADEIACATRSCFAIAPDTPCERAAPAGGDERAVSAADAFPSPPVSEPDEPRRPPRRLPLPLPLPSLPLERDRGPPLPDEELPPDPFPGLDLLVAFVFPILGRGLRPAAFGFRSPNSRNSKQKKLNFSKPAFARVLGGAQHDIFERQSAPRPPSSPRGGLRRPRLISLRGP